VSPRFPAHVAIVLIVSLGCSRGEDAAEPAASEPTAGAEAEADIGDAEPAADDVVRLRVPIEGSPAYGADRPLVVLVVFTDFECRFCRTAVPVIAELRRRYPSELRVVTRQFPLEFHRHAQAAAEASLEAFAQRGNAAFLAMHDRLFEMGALDDASLREHARAIGLDVEAFDRALQSRTHRDTGRGDVFFGFQIGIRGTPTFFVNGRPVVGAVPVEELDVVVREEIALARREIAAGADRDGTYRRRMATATRRVGPAIDPGGAPSVD
jgi:protein-disulfide isomerase